MSRTVRGLLDDHRMQWPALALATACALASCAGTTTGVIDAPPPDREEVVRDRPGYLWVRGHYVRGARGTWTWRRGHYIRERRDRVYVQGRWERRGDRLVWIDGEWRARGRVVVLEHMR